RIAQELRAIPQPEHQAHAEGEDEVSEVHDRRRIRQHPAERARRGRLQDRAGHVSPEERGLDARDVAHVRGYAELGSDTAQRLVPEKDGDERNPVAYESEYVAA